MKQTIAFLFMILLFPFPRLYAQDFWETLPFPDSLHIACIAINSEGSIFVGTVTSNVTNGIYRSEDSGETWEIVLNTSNFQIYSMTISVSGNIYVSKGGFDPFIVSYDNGNTWQILNIPYYTPFSKIHCIGTDTILCGASRSIGSGVVLLRTIDEGSNRDTLFITETHPSEYISDLAITGNGDI
ncbi:MAG: hypothetical protein IH597_13455 [Bacteroidales bacterium]|nr:hypothetical protein [Bacteroidales bacterium]